MVLEGYNGGGQQDPRFRTGAQNQMNPRYNTEGQSQTDPFFSGGSAQSPSDESGSIRDWQRETWFGTMPSNANPFDEPEDAPELLKDRSENLNDHQGEFWQQQTTGYQYRTDKTSGKDGDSPAKPGRDIHPLKIVLASLSALILVFVAVYYGIYQVTDIQVIGNSTISADVIIAASGLKTGIPILGIDEAAVARRIDQNPHLKYQYLEKKYPGTVILRVKEREECCWMTWCGIFYTMDKHRRVLSETENQTMEPENLVRVDGLGIRSGCMVGQTLVLENAKQEEVFSNLFLEMRVLNCTELIREVDLSNLYSLLLTTRDGFTVSMGDYENIHAKLRSMLLTREELLRMGHSSGVINVIVPEYPVYSPED